MVGSWIITALFVVSSLLLLSNAPNLRYDLQLIPAVVLLLVAVCSPQRAPADQSPTQFKEYSTLLLLLFVLSFALAAMISPILEYAVFPWLRWLYAAIAFFIVAEICGSPEQNSSLTKQLAFLGLLAGVFFIYFTIDPNSILTTAVFAPFSYNRNYLAHFLVVPLFCFGLQLLRSKSRGEKLCQLSLLLIIIIALVLTRSRAVFFGIFVALLVLAICNRKSFFNSRNILIIAVATLAALGVAQVLSLQLQIPGPLETARTILYPLEGSAGGRLRRWLNALPLIRDNLFFGIGPGRWIVDYGAYRDGVVADVPGYLGPFNGYLKLLAEVGVFVFGLFIAFLWQVFRRSNISVASLSAIAIAVAAIFHMTFSIPLLLLLWFVLLALTSSQRQTVSAAPALFSSKKVSIIASVIVLITFVPLLYSLRARVSYTILQKHQSYAGAAPTLTFTSSSGRAISPQLISLLPELNYRYNIATTRRVAKYASEGYGDFLTLISRKERRSDLAGAIAWVERALALNPRDLRALSTHCLLLHEAKRPEALSSCQLSLSVNPKQPEIILALAKLQMEHNDPQASKASYEQGIVVASEILKTPFTGSGGTQYRNTIAKTLNSLRSGLFDLKHGGPRLSPLQQQIAKAPQIHKRLAVSQSEIYFSSNEAGKFNLWKLSQTEKEAYATKISDDQYVYFQPQITADGSKLVFVSDESGNGKYRLFFRDLAGKTVSPLLDSHKSLSTFQLNPTNDTVAVVIARDGVNHLQLYSLSSGYLRTITSSSKQLSQLHWSAAGDKLAFVENKNLLQVYFLSDEQLKTPYRSAGVLVGPRLSTQPSAIAVIELLPESPNQLLLIANQEVSKLATDVVEAKFASSDKLFIRRKHGGSYSLHMVDTATGELRDLWTDPGVVYSLHPSPDGNTFFFWRSTPSELISLYSIDTKTTNIFKVYSAAKIAPESIVAAESIAIDTSDNLLGAYIYRPPIDTPLHGTVIWLHGSGTVFSPRWNRYAQFFAHSGFNFVALNYTRDQSKDPKTVSRSSAVAGVSKILNLLQNDGAEMSNESFIIGVSGGTRLARAVARKFPDRISGVVEYAPATTITSAIPVATLQFIGANDRRFRHADSDVIWPNINVQLIAGEGHDLRSMVAIESRLLETLRFFQRHGSKNGELIWTNNDK